jgi:hypothetical protein
MSMKTRWEACGLGPCAAPAGHAGTCAEASGWGEQWEPVAGFEGAYEVSDKGRVRSLARVTSLGRRVGGRVRRPSVSKAGYHYVTLSQDGRRETRSVHRMVLEAFVGPRQLEREARHRDGVPANNQLSNLLWGTHSENNLDRVAHGTHQHSRKTACKRGHPYVAGNVSAGRLEIHGTRQCLACQRAWTDAKRHGVPLTQDLADQWFARLTGATA